MADLSLIADSIPYSSPSTHEDSIVLSGRTATTSTGRKQKAKTSDSYELDNESKEANLNALVAFVVDHQQAFNLVENETLLQFRSTIDSIKGAIALTLDCWSSRVMRGYMVITVHWIDEELVKDFNMWSKIKATTSDSDGEMPLAMVIVRENLNDQYSLRLEDGFHIRCICHVINRVICDATHFIKKEGRVEVPGLDMETRWNTMFTMIDQSFQYRGVFSALCNSEELCDRLDWRVLKSCKDFLQSAYHCTVAASVRDYISLSLKPLIYKHLLTLCEKTRSKQLDTGFTTLIVKQAAIAMELKSTSIHFDDGLRLVFGCTPSPTFGVFDLFAGEVDSAIENVAHTEELDDFFMLTAKADCRVSDVLLWWKQHSNRFLTLSMMARDTLMIQGSFVASELAFLESGGFVRPDISKLSDENIEMMMKLKSWNHLFREDTLMIQGSFVASELAFLESGGFVRPDISKLSDENIEMMMKLKSWNHLFRE
ncbi:hypothetical protein MARPO_0146s0037 [Marchantia polymorpha]|uniref:HAT C-terminal dimerisation domain-containing protein n=1 Tax=Marchantia polymorpha TaxID=3197 RepID=A0A2R6W5T9_MARPO|nr:hypothetical protein MARPO_0146s0037 [Marchantia polymorpha]|eukprot:PTQ29221.1 hypothetical protein MARPO_0146s0037 [Marchantia polymorpha]